MLRSLQENLARLHFFKASFTTDEVAARFVAGSGPLTLEILKKTYLGFLIVKPIPQTFIGRTCLAC